MKIKCPICKSDINADNLEIVKSLNEHLNNHFIYSWKQTLVKQTIKIHEKIEELDEQGDEDMKHAYPSPCTDIQIDLLKSLLEDDDKPKFHFNDSKYMEKGE